MSNTPIFDETLPDHPEELWLAAPTVMPWPKHFSECEFDGYNWDVCTCSHIVRQLETVKIDAAADPDTTQALGVVLPDLELTQ